MKLILTIFLGLPLMSGNVLSAGEANYFTVDYVRVDKSGKGIVEFEKELVTTPAACGQVSYKRALAFDVNEPGGKAILSLALSAQASGRTIRARGTGMCSIYTEVEDWQWGRIH